MPVNISDGYKEKTMEFKDLTVERRSVRKYLEKPLSKELIEEILTEARMAPSWKNSETARIHVVMSEDKILEVTNCLVEFNRVRTKNAGALIVSTFVKNVAGFTDGKQDNELGNEWGAYDLGLHNSYMLLAAKNHGVDSLIMGLRDADAIRQVLGISDDEIIVSVIALGYGDGEPVFKERKAVEEITKFY